MRCPKCGGSKSSVVDSRQAEDGIPSVVAGNAKSAIIALLPTNEWEERTLVVVKKDGTREQFSRDKIFNGIIRSAQNGLFLVTKSKKL